MWLLLHLRKKEGCDYIVVGRSITKKANPVETYKEIEATMSKIRCEKSHLVFTLFY